MRVRALLIGALVAFGLVGAAHADPVRALWQGLGSTTSAPCQVQGVFDYWPTGGLRSFACRAVSVFDRDRFFADAPPMYVSGPHGTRGWRFDDPTSFGHYDPAFVRWFNERAIPAAADPDFRAATQPQYDAYVRPLARTYHAVYTRMQQRPAWVRKQVSRYRMVMQAGQPLTWEQTQAYDCFLGEVPPWRRAEGAGCADWGGYNPNVVRPAVLFWLRRTMDGTAPDFAAGLTTLLRTYDAGWLDHPTPPAR